MNVLPRHSNALAVSCFLLLSLQVFSADSNKTPNVSDDEMGVIGNAMKAAVADDLSSLAGLLNSTSKLKSDEAKSVMLSRRAVAVCGWFQNQGDYGRATKVAAWAEKLLSNLKEKDNASRLERLYWESLLLGRYLDQKVKTIPLLEEAVKLAPNDERISTLELEYADSIAQFGK